MADHSSPSEGGTFDNDFEKVDRHPIMDDVISSMSSGQPDSLPEDLYSANPVSSEAEAASAPLISLDEPSPVKPAEPAFHPDSSSRVAEVKKPQFSAGNWVKNIDPRGSGALSQNVLDLIYWRDPKKTGVVFGSAMVLFLSLALFSVLSVIAYLSLAALTVTVSFCVYKKIIQAVQKTGEGHPFKQYLDIDVNIPEDKVHEAADIVMKRSTDTLRELRRLFLCEDLVDSLKFGLLLWVLTYIGAWFNGMTLIILGVVSIFTIPKFYEVNKVQIDQYIDLARTQIKSIFTQIQEKIPMPGKKKTQ